MFLGLGLASCFSSVVKVSRSVGVVEVDYCDVMIIVSLLV